MSKKKEKGVKMNLGNFLGDSWADDVPDIPTAPALAQQPSYPSNEQYGFQRENSAYSSRERDDRPDIPIPNQPPYTAFIGNLSFEVTEGDIERFFGNTKSVRILVDPQTGKPKGFGYVEFEEREDLVAAVAMSGESLMNRNVRVNVAEGSKKTSRFDDAKFAGNWRQKPPADADRSFRGIIN